MRDFSRYDAFDIAEALDLWLQHNWSGQDSPLYAAHCELTEPRVFKARPSLNIATLEPNGLEVYGLLNLDNYETALNLVLNYKGN